jgi:hypothetical protein
MINDYSDSNFGRTVSGHYKCVETQFQDLVNAY